MNGRLGNIIAVTTGAYRLALRRLAPTWTVGQGTYAGRDSRAAREGAGAWDRPIGEIIARRAVRIGNRQPAAARYEAIHAILMQGRKPGGDHRGA